MEKRRLEFQDKLSASSGRQVSHPPAPIPDFKTLHAAHAELESARKAQIAPTVPEPLELHTEARSKERMQFERMRKAKEAEIERQKEELRMLREIEEQREVKELRRKAVPKANEVPEWYADAPKRVKG